MNEQTSFGPINAHYAIAANHVDGSGTVNFNFGEIGSSGKGSSDAAVLERALRNEREKCLRSLSFRNIDARLHDVTSAYPDTCSWLFDTYQFKLWKRRVDISRHNGVLWIKGKPGAGKSTLMKHIWCYRNEMFPEHVVAAHFFNARGLDFEKASLGMLRSVIHQLLDQDVVLYEHFVPIFRGKNQKHKRSDWEWRETELRDFLLSRLGCFNRHPVLLLIDALDECNEAEVERVVDLLESLSLQARATGVNLSICLSSRHYPNIGMDKTLELVVEEKEEHHRDIELYVSDKLKSQDDIIVSRILEKASGVFMWVVLVITMLNQAYLRGRLEAMHDVLDKVPSDLEQMFYTILNAGGEEWPETILMLQLVLFSKRPLKPVELCLGALAGTNEMTLTYWHKKWSNQHTPIESDILRRITTSSRGLIELRKREGTVQFIHESVRDFLLRYQRLRTLDPTLESSPIGTSHDRLKDCCLEYLLAYKVPLVQGDRRLSSTTIDQEFPFLMYAAVYIFDHAEAAQVGGISQASFLHLLRNHDGMFSRTRQLRRIFLGECRPGKDAKLLPFLLFHGYQEMVIADLAHDPCSIYNTSEYNEALEVAVMRKNLNILSLMLARGVDIDFRGTHYASSLVAAIVLGDHHAVQLLIEARANVNVECPFYGGPLQAATITSNMIILRYLLNNGADVNQGGGPYGHALMAAIVLGKHEMAKILIDQGADVDKPGGYYVTTLQAAARQRQYDTVKLLLCNGADVNKVGGPFRTALYAAIDQEDERMATILLNEGAKAHMATLGRGYDESSLMSTRKLDFINMLLKMKLDKDETYDQASQRLTAPRTVVMPPFRIEYTARQPLHLPLGILLPFHRGARRELGIFPQNK